MSDKRDLLPYLPSDRRLLMMKTVLVLLLLAISVGVSAEDPPMQRAIFAGGCFWCMEPPFEKLEGVSEVISGFTGGQVENPTYEQVTSGNTGHVEAVEIYFDPKRVSYEKLLYIFWRQINPTDAGGQFVDRGDHYRSAIFYLNDEQRLGAEESKAELAASAVFADPIVTGILPAGPFYTAEEYHQDYYRKNPLRYRYYRSGSGRDRFLDQVWGVNRPK